ncbi:MAG: hypothetical protein JRF06_06600 [Deltaproteobacteria bacterium]|nr:hypothetical protein [Deltaproteobacteria bacterium]
MKTKTPGRFLIPIGWLLIVVSGITLVGTLPPPYYRDPSIQVLLTHPDSLAIIGTIGVIIGFNFPAIFACLFGIYAIVRKNPKGKVLIIASVIFFVVNSAILFLPSSKSTVANHYDPIDTTTPGCEFKVSFPRPVKQKIVSSGGIESIAYESEGSASTPYLRAEFMQSIDTKTMANNFRDILENHARLSGLSIPEITESDDHLGKVGTYSGVKTVGDLTVKVYGKMILGKSSAINCMVVEQLEVFPSQDTVSFLGSIKKK